MVEDLNKPERPKTAMVFFTPVMEKIDDMVSNGIGLEHGEPRLEFKVLVYNNLVKSCYPSTSRPRGKIV